MLGNQGHARHLTCCLLQSAPVLLPTVPGHDSLVATVIDCPCVVTDTVPVSAGNDMTVPAHGLIGAGPV